MKTSPVNRRFLCEYEGCNKVFNRRDYLERHAANHLDVKPFRCNRCDRQFSRKDLYDNHLSTKFHAKRVLELHSAGTYISSPGEVAATIEFLKRDGDSSSTENILKQRSDSSKWTSPGELTSRSLSNNQGHGHQLPHAVVSSIESYQKALLSHKHNVSPAGLGLTIGGATTEISSPPEWPDASGQYEDIDLEEAGVGSYKFKVASRLNPISSSSFADSRIAFGSVSDPATAILGNFPAAGEPDEITDYTLDQFYRPLRRISEIASSISAKPSPFARLPNRRYSSGSISPLLGHQNPWRSHASRQSPIYDLNSNLDNASRSKTSSWQREMLIRDGILTDKSRSPSPSPHSLSPVNITSLRNRSVPELTAANTTFTTGASSNAQSAVYEDLLIAPISAQAMQQRIQWVFSGISFSKNDLRGYDKVYQEQARIYEARAMQFRRQYTRAPLPTCAPLNKPLRLLLTRILPSVDPVYFDEYLNSAWDSVPNLDVLLHKPTHDNNVSHPALLAVLIMLSMAQSTNDKIREQAEFVYPVVSAYVYELLNEDDSSQPDFDDNQFHKTSESFNFQSIGHLQAVALLARFEPYFAAGDAPRQSLFRFGTIRRLAERYLQAVRRVMPPIDYMQPSDPENAKSRRKLIYATIYREAYILHHGAEHDTQWREWAAYEATKRLMHYAMFTVGLLASCHVKKHLTCLSLFNLDTHMPAQDQLWDARDPKEFYSIVGQSMVVNCVPYLGVIRTLVRPDDVNRSSPGSSGTSVDETDRSDSYSAFALRTLGFGLYNLLALMLRKTNLDIHILDMLTRDQETGENSRIDLKNSCWFNRDFQAQVYQSIDRWFAIYQQSALPVQPWLFQDRTFERNNLTLKPDRLQWQERAAPSDLTISNGVMVLRSFRNASWIALSEDLPILLQVTSTLTRYLPQQEVPSGLNTPPSLGHEELLNFLYLPLYRNWLETDHAKTLVQASAELLLWMEAGAGQIKHCSWEDPFVSSAMYLATIVLWINDIADSQRESTVSRPHSIDRWQFVNCGVSYLQDVFKRSIGKLPLSQAPRGSIKDVILLNASILSTRGEPAAPLVSLLQRLAFVMDAQLSPHIVQQYLGSASEFFYNRHAPVLS